ncbi:MAG: recombinase RecT [Chloroflexota bacterium]|nr:recombinase RecT [Chloroflexota bacterium]
MTQTEQQAWDAAQATIKSHECICGAMLGIAWTAEKGWHPRCVKDRAHTEWNPIKSLVRQFREGEALPARIAGEVERVVGRLDLARLNPNVAIGLCLRKFTDLRTPLEASIFLGQCAQLGLNPFLGEAVPLVFNKDKPDRSVAFFVGGDGWATLASREEPDRWTGGPNLRRVVKPEDKVALGFNAGDFVVEAKGKVRGDPDEKILISAMKPDDVARGQYWTKANPWEMAEARATRRWIRQFFKGAIGKAQRLQAAALEGVDTTAIEGFQNIIEGEYREVVTNGGAKQLASREAPEDWDVDAARVESPAKPVSPAGPAASAKDEQSVRAEAIAKRLNWDSLRFAAEFESRAKAVWRLATPLTKAAVMDEMEREAAKPKQEAQS